MKYLILILFLLGCCPYDNILNPYYNYDRRVPMVEGAYFDIKSITQHKGELIFESYSLKIWKDGDTTYIYTQKEMIKQWPARFRDVKHKNY